MEITITTTSPSIGIGGYAVLNAICKDLESCPSLNWYTNEPSIVDLEPAIADQCIVMGKYPGSAEIFATADGILSNIITINVTGSVLQSITISPASKGVNKGEIIYFTALCSDQNDHVMYCPILLDWSSSDQSIGTVDSYGKFLALAEGTTTVTAYVDEIVSNSALVTVYSKDIQNMILLGITLVTAYFITKTDKFYD